VLEVVLKPYRLSDGCVAHDHNQRF
jgi:hypothetical protein